MPDMTDEQRAALHHAVDFLELGAAPNEAKLEAAAAIRAALKLIDEQQAALNAHESEKERAKRERPARAALIDMLGANPNRDSFVTLAIVEAIDAQTQAVREQVPVMNAVVDRLDLSLANALSTLEGV